MNRCGYLEKEQGQATSACSLGVAEKEGWHVAEAIGSSAINAGLHGTIEHRVYTCSCCAYRACWALTSRLFGSPCSSSLNLIQKSKAMRSSGLSGSYSSGLVTSNLPLCLRNSFKHHLSQ